MVDCKVHNASRWCNWHHTDSSRAPNQVASPAQQRSGRPVLALTCLRAATRAGPSIQRTAPCRSPRSSYSTALTAKRHTLLQGVCEGPERRVGGRQSGPLTRAATALYARCGSREWVTPSTKHMCKPRHPAPPTARALHVGRTAASRWGSRQPPCCERPPKPADPTAAACRLPGRRSG